MYLVLESRISCVCVRLHNDMQIKIEASQSNRDCVVHADLLVCRTSCRRVPELLSLSINLKKEIIVFICFDNG